MTYQVINTPGNDKRKSRLQKELKDFATKIDSIKNRSQTLLSNLQQLADKNKAETITSQIRNNLSNE